jgi:thymidylate synthase (FAD)
MPDWFNSVQEIQAIEDENFLDILDLALWNHLIPPELPQDERRALLKRHRNPRSWHQRLTENLAKETDMLQIEEVKNLYFPVLDQGFVALVDHMGGDDAVIRAARTSYGKGTKKTSTDRGLLRYLMRHRHTTPFEMVELVFHIGMPMDAWRQQIRHRTANVNEYSTRYSEAIDVTATTASDKWRLQSDSNKQGSGGYLEDSEVSRQLSEREAELHKMSRDVYEERLKAGIAREQARKDLPLSTYTMAYWKCDLHNLLHYLTLRCDTHAQLEIRSYAMVMAALANVVAPVTVEAWVDYHHCGAHFSRQERLALIEMAKTGKLPDPTQLGEMGLSNREVAEFVKKLTVPPVIPDLSLDLAKGLPPEHFGAIYGAEKSG